MLFELCAENLESALAAEEGGADRIELCADLALAGITPPAEMMAEALRILEIPIHVLIRPRAGDFVFSSKEFDCMRRQIEAAKRAGATGIATGILLSSGRVDTERTRALIDLARPMDVTFHRAFDETADLTQALEDVIETGADSLLTSGGAEDVLSGAGTIRELAEQAAGRIPLIAGGGLAPGESCPGGPPLRRLLPAWFAIAAQRQNRSPSPGRRCERSCPPAAGTGRRAGAAGYGTLTPSSSEF